MKLFRYLVTASSQVFSLNYYYIIIYHTLI